MKSNTKTAARTKRNGASAKASKKNAVATRATATQVIRPLTAGSLKDVLWETLTDLKHDNILPNRAEDVRAAVIEALDVRSALECARQAIEYSIEMDGTDPGGVLLQALNKCDRALSQSPATDAAFIDQIKHADLAPPEASFDNVGDMLNYLNDDTEASHD